MRRRFEIARPLEEMEVAVVRLTERVPELLNPNEEAVVRTALALARLYRLGSDGQDVSMGTFLHPFRERVSARLKPILLGSHVPVRAELLPHLPALREDVLQTREALAKHLKSRVSEDLLDRELRHKALVLVTGGGGGTGYVYLGVMAALDELGISPSLMVGTSIGAILSLFRSRMMRFDQTEIVNIVRGLTWKRLFRAISTENRYGLPAALRLFLRAGIGRYFNAAPETGELGMKLKELPIPTIVAVAGIRRGMLPRPLEFYERLLSFDGMGALDPRKWGRTAMSAMTALADFFVHPEIMVPIHLGANEATSEFDALDAAGFSSALPGVIHYDVLRQDARMHGLLGDMMESQELFRLVDGGLADNVPAKAAWEAVHRGRIGTRNALVVALNGFSSKITTPLWLPLQRLAEMNVGANRPYAHLVKDFRHTLSPLDLVPTVPVLSRAIEMGRAQMAEDLPFIRRMLTPLPPL